MTDPTATAVPSAVASSADEPSGRPSAPPAPKQTPSEQSAGIFAQQQTGRTFRLPRQRRLVMDLLAYWQTVPAVTHRRVLHIPRLAATRKAAARKISWPVLMMKAYALVAADIPELRRLYLRWPWERLYEHPTSACRMTISRDVSGQNAVLMSRTFDVERQPLPALDAEIRFLATAPVDDVELFRRQLNLARVPRFLRRFGWWVVTNLWGPLRVNFLGTFMVTTVSKWGAVSINPPVISASTLSFGRIDDDGAVEVFLTYDHRVFDGAINAKALVALEQVLEGAICDELLALQTEPASTD